jgi:uncharacterized protein YjbJ (UPF0337 family)
MVDHDRLPSSVQKALGKAEAKIGEVTDDDALTAEGESDQGKADWRRQASKTDPSAMDLPSA